MRKVQLFVASTFVGLIVVACGSATSNNPPGSGGDAGGGGDTGPANAVDASDATSSSPEDAGSCVIGDANISNLSPVDAALGEAGSVGSCLSCAKANCAPSVAACNSDCDCNTALVCIFDCIGGVGNTLLSCAEQCGATTGVTQGEGGVSGLSAAEKALLLCAYTQCKVQCDVAGLGGGGGGGGNKDSGQPDGEGSDGDTDASGDATTD